MPTLLRRSKGTMWGLGRSKLSKMLPSFSPRNLRIFENHPQKILEHDLALILILEPRRCSHSHLKFREFSRISWESSKFLKVIFSQGYRNRGGTWAQFSPHIFSQGCGNRGALKYSIAFLPPQKIQLGTARMKKYGWGTATNIYPHS